MLPKQKYKKSKISFYNIKSSKEKVKIDYKDDCIKASDCHSQSQSMQTPKLRS